MSLDRSDREGEDSPEENDILIDDIVIPRAKRFTKRIAHNNERLIIRKVINTNFKSYAGRTMIGPFNANFSCVIGANGCGKSNIIDALLFVFGFRSTKMRCETADKFIHKSKYFQDIRSCTVEVHFAKVVEKGDGKTDIIPGSEFFISRTVFKNRTSYYTISGQKVAYREVNSKLEENGVNLVHSRFLILQGDVEKIAVMQPKAPNENSMGMLEYLDNIIGTSRYKDAFDKLEKKLGELGDRKYTSFNEVKMAEEMVGKMKDPMEKIVLYLNSVNRVTRLKNQQLQLMLYQADINVKLKEEVKSQLCRKLESLNNKMNNEKEQGKNERNEIKKKEKNFNSNKEILSKLENQLQNFNKEIGDLKITIEDMKKRRKQRLDNIESDKRKLVKLEDTINNLDEEEKKLTQKLERLSKEKEDQSKILSAANENASVEVIEMQNEMNRLKAEENLLRDAYNKINTEYENKKKNLEYSNQMNVQEKMNLNELNEVKEKIEKIFKELKENELKLETYKCEKRDREMKIKELESVAEPLRKKKSYLNAEIYKNEEELRETEYVASNKRSNSAVLNYIMQRRSDNEIEGIFGRLGDLGGIDEKYDVAISTACGMLNYILVDRVQTMTMCFKALEKDNIGRASFISLQNVERFRSQMNIPIKTPENVPRLFDLIKVTDERVLPAFYFVMRDTLVAKDLKQAQRIAYNVSKRYRVVTLDGSLIELSGTMSGGGSTVCRGLMGSQVTVNTADTSIQQLQNQRKVDELKAKLTLLENELTPLEGDIADEVNKISLLHCYIKNMKTAIQDLKEQHKGMLNRKSELDEKIFAQTKRDDGKFRKLESEVEKFKEESQAVEKKYRIKKNEVKEIIKKIERIKSERTNKERKAFDATNEKWKRTDKELTEVKGKKNGKLKSIKEMKENITNNKKKLEEIKKEEKYAEKKEMLSKERDATEEKIEKLKPKVNTERNDLKILKEKHSEILKKIEHHERKILIIQPQLRSVEEELSEAQNRIRKIKHALNSLELKKVPELFSEEDEVEEEEGDEDAMEVEEEINDDENTPEPLVLLKYAAEQLQEMDEETIDQLIKTEEALAATREDVDLHLINNYQKKVASYKLHRSKLNEVSEQFSRYEKVYQEAKKNRFFEFRNAVDVISKKLKEVYHTFAPEGDAHLALLDATDPYTEGVNYNIRPPGKTWRQITMLSGGEKTLSSLALIFALHYYNPTPFYVMDEIDAALDYRNVAIVARYIKERTKNGQFVVVSLRSKMFDVGDLITGVTKIDDCTRICGFKSKYYKEVYSNNSNGMEINEENDESSEEDENGENYEYYDENDVGSPPLFDSED